MKHKGRADAVEERRRFIMPGMAFNMVCERSRKPATCRITGRSGDFVECEVGGEHFRAQINRLGVYCEVLILKGYDALFVTVSEARKASRRFEVLQDEKAGGQADPFAAVRSKDLPNGDVIFSDGAEAWCRIEAIPRFRQIIEKSMSDYYNQLVTVPRAIVRADKGIKARGIRRKGEWFHVYRRDLLEGVAERLGETGVNVLDNLWKFANGENYMCTMRDATPDDLRYAREHGISKQQVASRVAQGWTIFEATHIPLGCSRKDWKKNAE